VLTWRWVTIAFVKNTTKVTVTRAVRRLTIAQTSLSVPPTQFARIHSQDTNAIAWTASKNKETNAFRSTLVHKIMAAAQNTPSAGRVSRATRTTTTVHARRDFTGMGSSVTRSTPANRTTATKTPAAFPTKTL